MPNFIDVHCRGALLMALQLRPNCEGCDKDLPPHATDAMICTYECTFCAECIGKLGNVCPNCGGGFASRPIRPATEWRPGLSLVRRPASTERVHMSYSWDNALELVEKLRAIAPEDR